MDERVNSIRELEAARRADDERLQALLAELGAGLLGRLETESLPGDGDGSGGGIAKSPQGIREEYRRLRDRAAADRDAVAVIEAAAARLRELDAVIARREKDYAEMSHELPQLQSRLGEILLRDSAGGGPDGAPVDAPAAGAPAAGGAAILAPFREPLADALARKREREARSAGPERPAGGGISRIGRGARALAARAAIPLIDGEIERIHRSAGERVVQAGPGAAILDNAGDAARELAARAAALDAARTALGGELAALREERRRAAADAGTSPARRVRAIQAQIERTDAEARAAAARFGAFTLDPAFETCFGALMGDADRELAGRIAAARAAIAETDRQAARIRAAIEADEERAGVDRLNREIDAQRRKIAAAEAAIADLAGRIAAAEARIAGLRKIMEGTTEQAGQTNGEE